MIENDGLLANAATVGDALRSGLEAINDPRIGDVRGAGLYVGVEVVRDPETKAPDRQEARRLVNALRERHVLISVCGHDGNMLKIRPPLVFSMADVDWFCTAFTDSARRLTNTPRGTPLSMSVTAFQDCRSRTVTGTGTATRPRSGSASRRSRGRSQREVPRRPRLVRRDKKDNFTAYKLLIADVVDGRLEGVPRGLMAAGT